MTPENRETSARKQRGYLEYEVTYSDLEGLDIDAEKCSKNPGHTEFIPVKSFCFQSLPPHYRNERLYNMCLVLIDLTCMIDVFATSEGRPHDENVNCHLGKRIGSGSVYIPTGKGNKDVDCPCGECREYDAPRRDWYEVYVTTAYHVVSDDFEASHAVVRLHYDSEDSEAPAVTLRGYRVVNYNEVADRSILSCITHDARIVHRIQKLRATARDYEEHFRHCPIPTDPGFNLVVIVSHPHGQAKMISFGTKVRILSTETNTGSTDSTVWTEYAYDAPTCPGSSGALVWIYGKKRVGFRDSDITTHTHCGSDNGMNKSGLGLEFKSQLPK